MSAQQIFAGWGGGIAQQTDDGGLDASGDAEDAANDASDGAL